MAVPYPWQHNLVLEDLYRGKSSPALAEVVWEVASNAKVHLDHARDLRKTRPREAVPVLLPAVPADSWLLRLQKADFGTRVPADQLAAALTLWPCFSDVFNPDLRSRDPWLYPRLYWTHLCGRY